MKIFIYKSLIIFFLSAVLFKITFSSLIKNYESKIIDQFSQKNISIVQEKIRDEIRDSVSSDKKILKKEDALLIKKLIDKISKELRETD
jgi:hypothetical protein